MAPPSPQIGHLFDIPTRFMRSAQLERDFYDPAALDTYIVTPAVAESFRRLVEGVRPGSARRAWRVTGDYGVGKSSFALVAAQLLWDPATPTAARICRELGWSPAADQTPLWPVLITGAREDLARALARGLAAALDRRRPTRGRASAALQDLIARAQALQAESDAAGVEALLEDIRAEAGRAGTGVLLVVDELGKLLEHAAGEVGREDVFLLQRIAELAMRSGAQPLLFVGLLHQGFQAYAEQLPPSVRHEWDKVAGRFDELVFDQPLAHTAALVGGALGVRTAGLAPAVLDAARKAAKATAGMGWLAGATTSANTLDAAPLYPLHPAVLPPLVRFFARYGQHERSLFGFLLASEPFGVQRFAGQAPGAATWYSLAELYDYVRANFGHRLAGAQNHWLRITATVDGAQDLQPLEWRVLKAIGLLNLLDADDLAPTDTALRAAFSFAPAVAVDRALQDLTARGLLFRRGVAGGYRLWPNSSVNLHTAFEAAERALGPVGSVSEHLERTLDASPVLARRHYVRRGTMRFFDVRYARLDTLAKAADTPASGDGVVLIGLADTPAEQAALIARAGESAFALRADLVIGVLKPLGALSGNVRDLRCWQWVADNTPELGHDPYAAAEVSRQIARARRGLSEGLAGLSGLRQKAQQDVAWMYKGAAWDLPHGLSRGLSDLCDKLFYKAPRIANELLNRNVLSSPAAAARMRLLEGLFKSVEAPYLGIDPVKAPPEKSMYLSVIRKGGLHLEVDGGHVLKLPGPGDADPLNLAPALGEILTLLETRAGRRVEVSEILALLKGRPYGVRDGVAPLLLALVLKARGHEIAVYENGTFRATFGDADFMRLTKAPGAFALQHYKIEGVRFEVFARLAALFAAPSADRPAELLDVVGALCRFAAGLPDYTRKAGGLSPLAAGVRDVLLSAREPAPMLFQDLPQACGLAPFALDEPFEPARVEAFVEALEAAVAELRGAYAALLARLTAAAADAVGYGGKPFDRAHLAKRAARVSLTARVPRLRTFAMRLRDPGPSEDAWVEALASFVLAKPPSRWGASDEAHCVEELVELGELFANVESAAFTKSEIESDQTAVQINLTRGDGEKLSHVVHADPLDGAHAAQFAELDALLPRGREVRVQFLMQLLWRELDAGAKKAPRAEPIDRAAQGEAG